MGSIFSDLHVSGRGPRGHLFLPPLLSSFDPSSFLILSPPLFLSFFLPPPFPLLLFFPHYLFLLFLPPSLGYSLFPSLPHFPSLSFLLPSLSSFFLSRIFWIIFCVLMGQKRSFNINGTTWWTRKRTSWSAGEEGRLRDSFTVGDTFNFRGVERRG